MVFSGFPLLPVLFQLIVIQLLKRNLAGLARTTLFHPGHFG